LLPARPEFVLRGFAADINQTLVRLGNCFRIYRETLSRFSCAASALDHAFKMDLNTLKIRYPFDYEIL
ncbi:hypothetical protein ACLFKX_17305, partial [Enterobacter hormaechei]